jgi:hypothetical protein
VEFGNNSDNIYLDNIIKSNYNFNIRPAGIWNRHFVPVSKCVTRS